MIIAGTSGNDALFGIAGKVVLGRNRVGLNRNEGRKRFVWVLCKKILQCIGNDQITQIPGQQPLGLRCLRLLTKVVSFLAQSLKVDHVVVVQHYVVAPFSFVPSPTRWLRLV